MEQYQLANRVRYHAPSISFYRNGASCETIFFKQFVILYLISYHSCLNVNSRESYDFGKCTSTLNP